MVQAIGCFLRVLPFVGIGYFTVPLIGLRLTIAALAIGALLPVVEILGMRMVMQ